MRLILLFVLVVLAGAFVMGLLIAKKIESSYPWLPDYVHGELTPAPKLSAGEPRHIMFLFADHFEPHKDEDVDRWVKEYPEFARQHQDADGRYPQHSFFWMFFFADEPKSLEYLRSLSKLSYEGFGEVEKHLHHDEDTSDGFVEKMNYSTKLANWTGANITGEARPQKALGFIHGRWALDNSRGDKSCGVNNELILLREVGCYADFTQPSWGPMHPSIVNRFYYATDDPEKPKSYETGQPMKTGRSGVGDLLLITGQSVVHFDGLKPVYDHGEVDEDNLPTPERIDAWVKKGVHVEGRPEWIFIKVFTHGCVPTTQPVVLGEWRHKMHDYLETKYNDGENYVLHYVTARETYNIAKAAEAGKSGNPHDFRDFVIPPYVNRHFIASHNFEAISFEDKRWVVKFAAGSGEKVEVRLRATDVEVFGDAEVVEMNEYDGDTHGTIMISGKGIVGFNFSEMGSTWPDNPRKEVRAA